MTSTTNNNKNTVHDEEFWLSLQADMLSSNQSPEVRDIAPLIEQSFIFSMFFKSSSDTELLGFQRFLDLKNYGYLILIDLLVDYSLKSNRIKLDNLALYELLKNNLNNINSAVGPLIGNRISVLITHDSMEEKDSYIISEALIKLFNKNNLTVTIGIGNMTSLRSISTSFLDSITAITYCHPNHYMHVRDTEDIKKHLNFDYEDTEKHLLDAIKQKKVEAFNYFGMLMDWISPFNDIAKRNYIVELLILSAYAMRNDNPENMKKFNPLGKVRELLEYEGKDLLGWAFKQFVFITSFVKPQNSINHSNKIVRQTKEYLEVHFTEDISLEDAAAQVNVSPQYFSKLIKKNTGFNFIDWLSMMRVKKAKELFNTSNLSIKEVCFMIGYKDPNYFSRIFKKRVGITPSEYIKNSTYRKNDE